MIPFSQDIHHSFFIQSLLFLEDRRFWSHFGIDFRAIGRAMLRNYRDGHIQEGASTISMQLAKQLRGTANKTIWDKIASTLLALRIELWNNKTEILRNYIDRVEFGRLAQGPEAAARAYFQKPLSHLTQAQQITLLTLIKNPRLYNPESKRKSFEKRFNLIKSQLNQAHLLRFPEDTDLPELPYIQRNFPFLEDTYSSIMQKSQQTSIDIVLQKKIETIVENTLNDLATKKVHDAAVVVVDRETLQIRALIGGAKYHAQNAGQVNMVFSPRQPGSTLKPFLYRLALELRKISATGSIEDIPRAYTTAEGAIYEPKNYSLNFQGTVSIAQALAQSLNSPAIEVLSRVGVSAFLDHLRKLHITTLTQEADHYGLSLALGSGEVSLFELVRAYTIFSNSGTWCDLSFFESIQKKDCQKHVQQEGLEEVVHFLSHTKYKIPAFPLHSPLDFGDRTIFVKTGTSRNFRDNWSIGFGKKYLIGVWTGNKDGEYMRNVSGASGAGELFRRIIDSIDSSFVDTQEIVEEKHKQAVSLLSPVAGSIFILDPSRDNEAVITLLGDEPKNYTWELEGDGKILPLKTFRIPLKKGTWMLYGRPKYPSGNKLTSPFSVEEQ